MAKNGAWWLMMIRRFKKRKEATSLCRDLQRMGSRHAWTSIKLAVDIPWQISSAQLTSGPRHVLEAFSMSNENSKVFRDVVILCSSTPPFSLTMFHNRQVLAVINRYHRVVRLENLGFAWEGAEIVFFFVFLLKIIILCFLIVLTIKF